MGCIDFSDRLWKHYSWGKILDNTYTLEEKIKLEAQKETSTSEKNTRFVKIKNSNLSIVHCCRPRKYNTWVKYLKGSEWNKLPVSRASVRAGYHVSVKHKIAEPQYQLWLPTMPMNYIMPFSLPFSFSSCFQVILLLFTLTLFYNIAVGIECCSCDKIFIIANT